eukprot:2957552-Pyramimonas_sp.AAC.2
MPVPAHRLQVEIQPSPNTAGRLLTASKKADSSPPCSWPRNSVTRNCSLFSGTHEVRGRSRRGVSKAPPPSVWPPAATTGSSLHGPERSPRPDPDDAH